MKKTLILALLCLGLPIFCSCDDAVQQPDTVVVGKLEEEDDEEQEAEENESEDVLMTSRALCKCAVETDSAETARELIQAGADVNRVCDNYRYGRETPLVLAIQHGHFEVMRVLLEAGAEVNPPAKRVNIRFSPLAFAAVWHDKALMETLFAAGAKADEEGAGLMYQALRPDAKAENALEFVQYLVGTGKIGKKGIDEGLGMAAESGLLPVMRYMLEQGADINALSDSSWGTPLMRATLQGRKEAARLLLEAGAKPDIYTDGGYDAICCAIGLLGQPEILELLLAHGADPNRVNEEIGSTPLMEAIVCELNEKVKARIVRILLQAGATFNDSYYLLWMAAVRGETQVMDLLYKPGRKSTHRNC